MNAPLHKARLRAARHPPGLLSRWLQAFRANPRALGTPPPVAAVCHSCFIRVSFVFHSTPRPRQTAPPPCGTVAREALREAIEVIEHLWLAPFASSLRGRRIGRACEQSGRAGSRCRQRSRSLKWNLFDVRPLFHLTRCLSRRRRAAIVSASPKQCRALNEKSFALHSSTCPTSINRIPPDPRKTCRPGTSPSSSPWPTESIR